jgi:hypothetical protein
MTVIACEISMFGFPSLQEGWGRTICVADNVSRFE